MIPLAMWCCRCQQDVPAARGLSGPPKCTRCRGLLIAPPEARAVAAVSDCGLELDAFSRAIRPRTVAYTRRGEDRVDYELRRLQRMLRPMRVDEGRGSTFQASSTFDVPAGDRSHTPLELEISTTDMRSPRRAPAPPPAWGVSLLILAGATALISGMLLLVAANTLLYAAAWRWGFAATIGGEGLLLGGIAIMATRLWRNSRRLNSQLDAVDRRLAEVQSTLLQPAASPTVGSLRSAVRRLDRPTAIA
jgi:hypothetical protein